MDERFERQLRIGLADLLDTAAGDYPAWATSPAAGRVAGDRPMPWRVPWRLRPALLRLALVAVAVLAAGLAASLVIRPAVIFGPAAPATPTPHASPAASPAASAGSDILAVTVARPAPPAAECPAGADPDRPGDRDQARPEVPSMTVAFDRRAGRIVALAGSATWSRTWTYDVCANAWAQSAAASPPRFAWLVYDVDSDRTVALAWQAVNGSPLETWTYDLAADRWARGADAPFRALLISVPTGSPSVVPVFGAYDPSSGLVVFAVGSGKATPGSISLWAYEPEADAWTPVRQRGDPASPAADTPAGIAAFSYDASVDRFVAVDGKAATWTFDPRRGIWRDEGRQAAVYTSQFYDAWGSGSVPVFDETAGLTLYPDGGGRVAGYAAASNAWSTLADRLGRIGCTSLYLVAYDSLDGRMVCLDWSETPVGSDAGVKGTPGVAAFDTTSREWRLLLAEGP